MMMKTTKWKSVALMGMLVAVASGCAADEEMNDKATGSSGKQITIMVGTESGSNTRVSYDEDQNGTPWLTWELGDKLLVVGYNDGILVDRKVYLLNAEDHGKTIGAFTGDEIVGADGYRVFYPHTGDLSIVEQTQVGDKSTAHLKDNIFLQAFNVTDLSNISLSMETSILKFDLSGIPKEVGTLKQLKWVIDAPSGEQTHILNFSTAPADKIEFSDIKDDLTAYLAFSHVTTMIKQGGKFRVELIGDKIYQAETTLDANKYYESGHWYTALIDGLPSTMEWKPKVMTISTGAPEYNFLEIGYISSEDQKSIKVAEFQIRDGKVSFDASLIPNLADSTVWFCIPKFVKYIHKIGPDGLGNELTLPDRKLGSTLYDNPKVDGKSYKNDWIVALYMGLDKNGEPYGDAPIYWATGNLIATKVVDGGYNNDLVSLHIATLAETQRESEAVANYFPQRIIDHSRFGYRDCDEGAQWNLFPWNAFYPTVTASGNSNFVETIDGGNIGGGSRDLSYSGLEMNFRLPFGDGDDLEDSDTEMGLLVHSVPGVKIEPWEIGGREMGRKVTYSNGPIVNTLYFPFTGWARGVNVNDLGSVGKYWSGSGEAADNAHASAYKFSSQIKFERSKDERANRYAIRPVTE